MKNLKYLLLAFMISPMFLINVGCGDDDTPPIIQDTTDTVVADTPAFGFTVSFQNYQLVLDANQSSASYRKDLDESLVTLVGYSTKGESGATITSKAELELTFPGKTAGIVTEQTTGFTLEIATGEGAKRVESSSDIANSMTVTISEYGEVGEMIKGLFTGELKSGINSRAFTKGYFNIERDADR